jgi:hypothetical protein
VNLQNRRQVENTRKKLQILEDQCEALKSEVPENAATRELTIRSLMKLINQMKEEIIRFECRASVRSDAN